VSAIPTDCSPSRSVVSNTVILRETMPWLLAARAPKAHLWRGLEGERPAGRVRSDSPTGECG
jgi:hypothetical protein